MQIRRAFKLTALAALVSGSSGCDPGYSFYIYNRTNHDRAIHVIYPPDYQKHAHFLKTDSICFSDTGIRYNGSATVERCIAKQYVPVGLGNEYSFILPSGNRARVNRGIGGLPAQTIILDSYDTIISVWSRRIRPEWHFSNTVYVLDE